jgi:hypothetical protein
MVVARPFSNVHAGKSHADFSHPWVETFIHLVAMDADPSVGVDPVVTAITMAPPNEAPGLGASDPLARCAT